MKLSVSIRKFQRSLRQAATRSWLTGFMRLGYAAKGILYFFIGFLAGRAAILPYAKAAGSDSVLRSLVDKPFGKLFLCLFAISLLGYVLRRFLQATINLGRRQDPTKIIQRMGYAMSGCSYLGVSYSAFSVVVGIDDSDDMLEDLARQLLDRPFGNWLVGCIGLVIVGIGCSYVYGAITKSYLSDLESSELHHQVEDWITRLGQFGVVARGAAFVLIGAFFTQAAVQYRSEVAGGLEKALQQLAEQPYGPLWLSLVGLGLIAYGFYMVVAAWYRPSVIT